MKVVRQLNCRVVRLTSPHLRVHRPAQNILCFDSTSLHFRLLVNMPVYTVYHRSRLSQSSRKDIAQALTNLHSTTTGAPPQAVKVIYISLDKYSFFSGGETKQDYVRIVAQIRKGRSEEQKMSILRGMFEIVQKALHTHSSTNVDTEIQTQIVEIDDAATVMTNGKLNV